MSDGTGIEWTDATANVINGCSLASPGCTNCYAMRLAGTRMKHHPTRAGLTMDTKAGPVWTGDVRFHEPALQQVLRWQRGRMIFWNAHGDMFHPSVPVEWIDRCFAGMALTPQHIHQVLTKRSDRMREYCISRFTTEAGSDALCEAIDDFGIVMDPTSWDAPLPNVWLGVSAEDQTRADERIPDLLATPAAVRWVSAEPLLGPIDLTNITGAEKSREYGSPVHGWSSIWRNNGIGRACLDWVVVGGESGPGARPMHPDWARSLRDQCAAAGVAFHFKQHGEFLDFDHLGMAWNDLPDSIRRNQQFVEGKAMIRVGKRAAGRLLYGVTHDGYPGMVAA